MADSPEESSWTFYIQGFICDDDNDNNDNDDDENSCAFESPSLVSDADSSAVVAKRFPNHFNWTQEPLGFSSAANDGNNNNSRTILSKQNSFKKQKTKLISAMDHDLEDTASSPVNSPKVSYMNHFMNHEKKEKAKMDVSEVKSSFGKVFAVERDSNYVDLKKRSTCG
ncbi:hypothetical protein C2S53_000874 [Perilla frutescens var. hirtella]|uniref:Uncharacterized protein n=1 Tax=Perilla frutescens var. hirtella TaxID=608512 RepID=A0AAD4PC11_PERFH|nr:hypothetical protein C2S53_000874 [Perilla frutescens var. hirtella]